MADTRSGGSGTLSGDRAFQLHDTYGFPIDLTLEMASEQGLSVDADGFRALMAEQKARAKADSKSKKAGAQATEVYRELRATGITPFTGYTELATDSSVRGIVLDGEQVAAASEGDVVEVVLEKTPFYAESGGQDSDAGTITGDGVELEVLDVQRPVKGLVVHRVRVVRGELQSGTDVLAQVDGEWRLGACQAHSGTHVVHAALRQVLGPTALQSGSYNKPGYLRLDFAWQGGLSQATRSDVEEAANRALRADLDVTATSMPLARAREIGALALFGETYDEEVRVVEMGGPWSRELCGGTHVQHSSQVGLVTLTTESSVGSGVRRVEAFVGIEAFRFLAAERSLVHGLTETLKVQPDQLTDRVHRLVSQLKDAERQIADLRSKQVLAEAGTIAAQGHEMWGVQYIAHAAPGVSGNDLRSLALEVRNRVADQAAVVAVVGGSADKPSVVVVTTAGARDRRLSAGDLVRVASETLGGRGGGKPDIAQGGGSDGSKTADALTAVEHAIGHTLLSRVSFRQGRPGRRRLGRRPDRRRPVRPGRHPRHAVRDGDRRGSARSPTCSPCWPSWSRSRSSSACRRAWPAPRGRRRARSASRRAGSPRRPPVPVRLVDERLTTVEASRRLREGGRKAKQQRSVIDAAAAAAILEHALGVERSRGEPPGALLLPHSA